MKIGYFLSSEEYRPAELVEQAELAERAGFDCLWISDHFHPWNDAQGQSPFVWSVIGAISQVCALPITTAVTCPIQRIHPAVLAQAAATSAVLTHGRFTLGLGTGEALNEHVTGGSWPPFDQRWERLDEAVGLLRQLLTGREVNHHGRHFTVENARLYTVPDQPPAIYLSGFGEKAAVRAGDIGDGYITTKADAEGLRLFRSRAGGKPAQAGYKVCWAADEKVAVQTAHRLWASSGLPGELAQILPTPQHFEQASTLVTPEATAASTPCGNDVERHLSEFGSYLQAGFDEIYIGQIGGAQPQTSYHEFFRAYHHHLLPQLRQLAAAA